MNLDELAEKAIAAALSAGEIIQKYKNKDFVVEKKDGVRSFASQVVTEADLACEKIILSHLLPTCEEYDIALLSEETEDDGSRFEKDFFWCIDPIDGTLPFIKKQAGFSVSIALVAKDGSPIIGVVFDPSTKTMYHAVKGKGVFKNNDPWILELKNEHLSYVTDRTLAETTNASEIADMLNEQAEKFGWKGVKEIAGGGSVLNAIRVLENGPACMLKQPKKENGGGCIWDFAATACIFHEAGVIATNFEGGRLDLNKKDGAFMNDEGVFYANFSMKKKRV